MGPLHTIWRAMRYSGSLHRHPIKAPPVSRRPKAAAGVGHAPCTRCACATTLVVTAATPQISSPATIAVIMVSDIYSPIAPRGSFWTVLLDKGHCGQYNRICLDL